MKQDLISTPRLRPAARSESTNGLFQQLLAESAREWRLDPRFVLLIFLAPILLMCSGVAAALLGDEVYKWLTGEDRFAENLQVFFWLLAFGAGFLIMRRLWKAERYGLAFLYLGLNAGIFFIIGEELSWGQRIFGWVTPEAWRASNRQRETTIHNLNSLVSTFRWLYLIIGAYGAILPLILRRPLARYRRKISMLVPHYTLVPYFFTTLAWRIYLNFWKLPEQHYYVLSRFSEVIELILAMAFFLFMSFQSRKISQHG